MLTFVGIVGLEFLDSVRLVEEGQGAHVANGVQCVGERLAVGITGRSIRQDWSPILCRIADQNDAHNMISSWATEQRNKNLSVARHGSFFKDNNNTLGVCCKLAYSLAGNHDRSNNETFP